MARGQACVQQLLSPREAWHGQDMAADRDLLKRLLSSFNEIISGWNGSRCYTLGLKQPHWRGVPLEIHLRTKDAGEILLALSAIFSPRPFVAGDVGMSRQLVTRPLAAIRDTMNLALPWWRLLPRIIAGRTYLFQNSSRARVNIKSHYDIPQEALQLYLDRVYMSYSCGMFEYPALAVDELVRVGRGQSDDFRLSGKSAVAKVQGRRGFRESRKGRDAARRGLRLRRSTSRRARKLSVRQGRRLDALAQPGRRRLQRLGAV